MVLERRAREEERGGASDAPQLRSDVTVGVPDPLGLINDEEIPLE